MHSFSFFICPTIICLTVLSFPIFADDLATEGGACSTGELDFDVDSDDRPALSLMQRHARLTSVQHTRAEEADREALASSSGTSETASAKPGVEVSKPWRSSLVDAVGPVPFAMLAFNSDVHTIDKDKITPNTRMILFIFVPVAAIGLTIILCCLLSDQRKSDDGSKLSPSGSIRSPLQSGVSGIGSQNTLSSSGSLTRMGTPAKLAFSPLQPTVRLPANQMPRVPACLAFPTMSADVRRRNRGFDVYWGQTDAPWFRIEVRQGDSAKRDKLELYEVHDGLNTLCAYVNLDPFDVNVVDGQSHWRVTNHYLKANTRGLAYRADKDNSKVRNAVATWEQVVPGVDQGDGWLKVGDWYLPMKVDGNQTITKVDAGHVPQYSGLQVMRGDGVHFATLQPNAGSGGNWAAVRHGVPQFYISIGTSNLLLEAKLPNGKRVAAVRKEQVRLQNVSEMMLELSVEPETDPVIMLIGSVAVLRQLPAHQE